MDEPGLRLYHPLDEHLRNLDPEERALLRWKVDYAVFLEGAAARALEALEEAGVQDWGDLYSLRDHLAADEPPSRPLVRRIGWDLSEALRPIVVAMLPDGDLDEATARLIRSPKNTARLLRALLRSRRDRPEMKGAGVPHPYTWTALERAPAH
jgi:hypothetical protein